MSEPLVSIIIPVYNGSNYMREAIDSALAQKYNNFEIIVVNDGSKDNGQTEEIAKSYGDRIRYFSKPNGGVSSALNMGIRNMRGEYFSWLSHDDVYEPDKVSKQVEAMQGCDKQTIICCEASQIDEFSRPITTHRTKSCFAPDRIYAGTEVLEMLLKKAPLHGCSLLIPKAVLENAGGFDEDLRFCQDYFMWYKLFLGGCSLKSIPEKLVKGRIHGKQLTQTGQSLFKTECAQISHYLTAAFAQASSRERNLLRLYLLSDARFLPSDRVKEIMQTGRNSGLLSLADVWMGWGIFLYGKIRPLLRRVYYLVFRRLKTA